MIQMVNQNMLVFIMLKNMKKFKFFDIDVIEFVCQFMIIEFCLYGKIKLIECLNKIWQKKVGEGELEFVLNVKVLIFYFN